MHGYFTGICNFKFENVFISVPVGKEDEKFR